MIMKTMKWMIGVMLVLFALSVTAQQATSAEQDMNSTQNDAEVNDAADSNDEPGTGDTPGATEAASAANNSEADSATNVSNAPAVPQTTSSSSGSPAVLSGQNGEERDGTNTVQRASMNMVGSPAGNLNLSDVQAVDADTELADRQDRAQEKDASAQIRSQGGAPESNKINDNNRKENNALSDQNLSPEEKKDQPATEENKKQDKRKRKKDKG